MFGFNAEAQRRKGFLCDLAVVTLSIAKHPPKGDAFVDVQCDFITSIQMNLILPTLAGNMSFRP